jgi:hypothetical protein
MEIKVKDQIHQLSNWGICGDTSRSRCRVSMLKPDVDTLDQIVIWYVGKFGDGGHPYEEGACYASFEGCFLFMQEIFDGAFYGDAHSRFVSYNSLLDLQDRVDNFIRRVELLKVFI